MHTFQCIAAIVRYSTKNKAKSPTKTPLLWKPTSRIGASPFFSQRDYDALLLLLILLQRLILLSDGAPNIAIKRADAARHKSTCMSRSIHRIDQETSAEKHRFGSTFCHLHRDVNRTAHIFTRSQHIEPHQRHTWPNWYASAGWWRFKKYI